MVLHNVLCAQAVIRARELNNPRFGFLWPGSSYHWYYRHRLGGVLGVQAVAGLLSGLETPQLQPQQQQQQQTQEANDKVGEEQKQRPLPPWAVPAAVAAVVPSAEEAGAAAEDGAIVSLEAGTATVCTTATVGAAVADAATANIIMGPCTKPLVLKANPRVAKLLHHKAGDADSAAVAAAEEDNVSGIEPAGDGGVQVASDAAVGPDGGVEVAADTAAAENATLAAQEGSADAVHEPTLQQQQQQQQERAEQQHEFASVSDEQRKAERRLRARLLLAQKQVSRLAEEQQKQQVASAHAILHHRSIFLHEEDSYNDGQADISTGIGDMVPRPVMALQPQPPAAPALPHLAAVRAAHTAALHRAALLVDDPTDPTAMGDEVVSDTQTRQHHGLQAIQQLAAMQLGSSVVSAARPSTGMNLNSAAGKAAGEREQAGGGLHQQGPTQASEVIAANSSQAAGGAYGVDNNRDAPLAGISKTDGQAQSDVYRSQLPGSQDTGQHKRSRSRSQSRSLLRSPKRGRSWCRSPPRSGSARSRSKHRSKHRSRHRSRSNSRSQSRHTPRTHHDTHEDVHRRHRFDATSPGLHKHHHTGRADRHEHSRSRHDCSRSRRERSRSRHHRSRSRHERSRSRHHGSRSRHERGRSRHNYGRSRHRHTVRHESASRRHQNDRADGRSSSSSSSGHDTDSSDTSSSSS